MNRPRQTILLLAATLCALVLIGWALGELTAAVAQPADLHAVRELAASRVPWITGVAHLLSLIGSGFVLFPLTAVCCVGLYRRGRRHVTLMVAVSTIGGVVIANAVKILVDRARPPVRHLEHVMSASFPSGHATQSTAAYLALLMAVLVRPPGRPAAIAASIATVALILGIGFSRVYLGVHYPSDVVAGMLLGSTWTLLVSLIVRRDAHDIVAPTVHRRHGDRRERPARY